jgi:hypothetical protein
MATALSDVEMMFCRGCKTIVGEDDAYDGTYCPHCKEFLSVTPERKLAGMPIFKEINANPSTAIRIVPSPWGSIRLALSRMSHFCPFAYFIREGSVIKPAFEYGTYREYTTRTSKDRDAKGKMTPVGDMCDYNTRADGRIDASIWSHFQEEGNAPATYIRAMINEEFSVPSIDTAWKEYSPVGDPSIYQWLSFVENLKLVVTSITCDPNEKGFEDLTIGV